MARPDDRTLSKFLSLVLRHDPSAAGITLDDAGWASLDGLIAGAPWPIDREDIRRVVAESDKQRFLLSPDGNRIRANQGHSVAVDVGLTEQAPPETLYHGTAERTRPAILAEGLKPMARLHVHLSADPETARQVGQRHGAPVVFRVAAGVMAAQGHKFWISENGGWLVEAVPPGHLSDL